MQSKVLKEIERNLVTNFLDVIILAEIKARGSIGGYDLMDLVYKKSGILISPGTAYAVLYSIERKDLVKGAYVQKKRAYTLTDKGMETIDTILKSKEEIQRFMGNLF